MNKIIFTKKQSELHLTPALPHSPRGPPGDPLSPKETTLPLEPGRQEAQHQSFLAPVQHRVPLLGLPPLVLVSGLCWPHISETVNSTASLLRAAPAPDTGETTGFPPEKSLGRTPSLPAPGSVGTRQRRPGHQPEPLKGQSENLSTQARRLP